MRLFIYIFIFFATIIGLNMPAFAQDLSQKPGIITISGSGEVNAAPDIAYISLGVISVGESAKQAIVQNSKSMNNLMDILEQEGIERKDIQTTNFSISPQYSYDRSGNNRLPEIVNYRANNMVRIIVRDLDNLGNIIDKTVSSGANSINSISFSVDDNSELLNKARQKAMEDAINKAELYADAANVKLGRIILISENDVFLPPPPIFDVGMSRQALMPEKSLPTPIQSGELSFRAKINVQWEIIQ